MSSDKVSPGIGRYASEQGGNSDWRYTRVKKPSGRNGNGTGDVPEKNPERSENAKVQVPEEVEPACAAERANVIRAALAGGRYRVESKKVAEKIVDDAVREIRNRTR